MRTTHTTGQEQKLAEICYGRVKKKKGGGGAQFAVARECVGNS